MKSNKKFWWNKIWNFDTLGCTLVWKTALDLKKNKIWSNQIGIFGMLSEQNIHDTQTMKSKNFIIINRICKDLIEL